MYYTNQGQYVVCVVQRGSRNSRLRGEWVALSLAVFHCLWCDSIGRNCQKIERKSPLCPHGSAGGCPHHFMVAHCFSIVWTGVDPECEEKRELFHSIGSTLRATQKYKVTRKWTVLLKHLPRSQIKVRALSSPRRNSRRTPSLFWRNTFPLFYAFSSFLEVYDAI